MDVLFPRDAELRYPADTLQANDGEPFSCGLVDQVDLRRLGIEPVAVDHPEPEAHEIPVRRQPQLGDFHPRRGRGGGGGGGGTSASFFAEHDTIGLVRLPTG